MIDSDAPGRVVSGKRDCRYCIGAFLALSVAAVSVVYGLTHQDLVTALGGLLFVPTAALLAGIGLTGGGITGDSETETETETA
jgi:uncharacterized protein GlcG (DUF336 family)